MGVKWIKLSTDIFDNRKIKAIESMPDGDSLIVVWLKLLILAGTVNDNGCVYFTKDIPYTDQLLATQFGRPLATIQLALQTFERFGMIEVVDDMIFVSNWERYQNVEGLEKVREQTRIRNIKYRERKKLTDNVTRDVTVTSHDATERDIDKDIDIEKKKDPSLQKDRKKKYGAGENVLLTDEEYEKLQARFPDYLERIDRLSYYIGSKGVRYKSHYMTILNWASKEKETPARKKEGRLDWIDNI